MGVLFIHIRRHTDPALLPQVLDPEAEFILRRVALSPAECAAKANGPQPAVRRFVLLQPTYAAVVSAFSRSAVSCAIRASIVGCSMPSITIASW